MKIATLAAVIAFVFGSAAVADPSPPPSAAPRATAPAGPIGPPPAGQGRLVFYRPSALWGLLVSPKVSENGVELNTLGNGRYFVVDTTPGAHTFTIQVSTTNRLLVDVTAGQTYYVWGGLGSGFGANATLEPSYQNDFDQAYAAGKLKPAPSATRPN